VASPPDTEIPAGHFRQGRLFPAVPPSQRAAARPLGPVLRPAVVSTVTPKGVKELDINARTRNALLSSARCLGERGFALLSQRWKTLQNVTASPRQIGPIARAVLVLVLFEHKRLM
jgi:DDE superfamily endonuclease